MSILQFIPCLKEGVSLSLSRKRSYALFALFFVSLLTPRTSLGQAFTFTVLAGPQQAGAGFDDGTGSEARFNTPFEVATDSSGNVYVADRSNHTIRKITPAGAVTTLAGLAATTGSADGNGSAARFNLPSGVATDSSGNVYIADLGNHTIRKITPAGAVTTLAGLAGNSGSADGTGSAARFDSPRGVATDVSGNVYIADSENHTIRKISPVGVVTTLAGLGGSFGSSDGTGAAARFINPTGVATDGSGNVYVADTGNSTIRKITPAGAVATMAGLAGSFESTDGTGFAARFNNPSDVATDSSGNVYVADVRNHTIRKIAPPGVVTTLAGLAETQGSADGTGSAARFNVPIGVATDSSGNVYVADTRNSSVRKITPAGAVTTLAGLPGSFGSADGTGSSARFSGPSGVATDSMGSVYVADQFNHTIRKVALAGAVTTLAGLPGSFGSADGTGSAARFDRPFGVATDSIGNVYVPDQGNNTIRKITPTGAVSTLAGRAGSSGSADGSGSAAQFNIPAGVATDDSGNVYVADSGNSTIRKITPAGAVTTLAGFAGAAAGSADGAGSAARFNSPYGVATDSGGNVYVADHNNHTIRKITPAGDVTTLAGLSGSLGSVDGTGIEARFNFPIGVATDSQGNVYIADSSNHAIRMITPAGAVTTLAGLAGTTGSADGTGFAARFNFPTGVATDSSGNVFVADMNNNTIRIGRSALADSATIDLSAGPRGASRQLDISPRTAEEWQWSVIRRPVDSVALLSSTTIRNPTFTPDVPGLFIFRVIATSSSGASITTVDLTATGAPGVVGDVNGDTQVSVADVFYLINFLFTSGPAPIGSGDVDADGTVSVADVFYLINFLFAGGPAPR